MRIGLQMLAETAAMQDWREFALSFPEVTESGACVRVAFKARKKGFLYMGAKAASHNALLKLADSLPQAEQLAAAEPGRYRVGKGGWVTVEFPRGCAPDLTLMKRWIEESFRITAPKTLLKAWLPGPR